MFLYDRNHRPNTLRGPTIVGEATDAQMKRDASPPTSPSCLPELGARSATDFEHIARDDRQSMVKPLPIEPKVPEL